jgi:hypothetical protein
MGPAGAGGERFAGAAVEELAQERFEGRCHAAMFARSPAEHLTP